MSRYKYPIEYDLSPDTLENGAHWLTLRLQNKGDENLQNLNIKMHSLDSFHISFRNPSDYIYLLKPNEEKYLNFQVDANVTSHLYISIHGRKNGGGHFHWDSPLLKEVVLGDDVEIETILVSNPYGSVGKELDVEAVLVGLGDSQGLGLSFWADTPSHEYEEIENMKTRRLSNGEATYSTEMKPKEEGYYTVYVSLHDDYRLIDRDYDTIWVEK